MMSQRNSFKRSVAQAGAIFLGMTVSLLGAEVTSEPAAGLNLVTNSSFEGDWYNTRAEVMSCPVEPRVTFGQADGLADGWKLTQPGPTPNTIVEAPALRSHDAH